MSVFLGKKYNMIKHGPLVNPVVSALGIKRENLFQTLNV